jgi:tetratricopeptide (TPR) repeat protein
LPSGAFDFTLKGIFGPNIWEYAQKLNEASLAEIQAHRISLLPPIQMFARSLQTKKIGQKFGPLIVKAMANIVNLIYSQYAGNDAQTFRQFFTIEEPNLRNALYLQNTESSSDIDSYGKYSDFGMVAHLLLELYIFDLNFKAIKELEKLITARLKKLGDWRCLGGVLHSLGECSLRMRDELKAINYYKKALENFEKINFKMGEANLLLALATATRIVGKRKEAKGYCDKALEIYKQLNGKLGQANTLFELGQVFLTAKDQTIPKEYLDKALALYRKIHNRLGEANVFETFSYISIRSEDNVLAKEYSEKALALYVEIGDKIDELHMLKRLLEIAKKNEKKEDINFWLTCLLKFYREAGDREKEEETMKLLDSLR